MDVEFDALAAEVVDEAMRDWGRPIVVATVLRVYEPSAGTQVATIENAAEVTAILSTGEVSSRKGTAAVEKTRRTVVLVRRSEYGAASIAGRVVAIDGVWFDVVSIEERAGGVLALTIEERSAALEAELIAAVESGVAA